MLFQQRAVQGRIGKQLTERQPFRFTLAEGDQRRVGQQHAAGAIHCQHRVGHRREQSIELQAPALAGKDVDDGHRLHAAHPEQRLAQLVEHRGAESRCVYVDVRRHHLHRIQVEIAPAEQGQDFLGDTNAVDKADVDAHVGN
ncbi:hypothetical protein D3C85_803300 [compost metagenome]